MTVGKPRWSDLSPFLPPCRPDSDFCLRPLKTWFQATVPFAFSLRDRIPGASLFLYFMPGATQEGRGSSSGIFSLSLRLEAHGGR